MSAASDTVPRPSRRAVLRAAPAAVVAAALAGCTSGSVPDVDPVPSASPDPDDTLRESAAERERGLLREYDWLLLALPELAARLAPLRAHHAEHLAALVGPSAGAPPSAAAAAPSGRPSPSAAAPAPPPSAPAPPPPADVPAVLARLVAAERAAGAAHARDCLAASRSLAPVLASLSASELSHPVALG